MASSLNTKIRALADTRRHLDTLLGQLRVAEAMAAEQQTKIERLRTEVQIAGRRVEQLETSVSRHAGRILRRMDDQ